jgi:enoyl-CoA hydratase/carnithine racemase
VELHEYKDRYSTAEVTRDDAGVLTIRMHWRGKSLMWGGPPHQELPELFNAIASDRENRVVILTGTGATFIGLGDGPNPLAEGRANATVWDRIIWEGNRLVDQMLAIEVPMIAAVNGPVSVHSELARGRYFLLTGQKIHAEEARQLGIVGEVLPGDQVLARAQEIAAGLASLNPILLRNTRHALVRPLRRAVADDLHTGLALEAIASMSAREWNRD